MEGYKVYYLIKGLGAYIECESQERAMRWAKQLMLGRQGRLGELEAITVMQDGEVVWKWQFGKGITFPSAAELAQHVGVNDE